MKKKIFVISALTVTLLVASSFQENSFIDRLVLVLDKYTQEFPQEKVYVHFDKPYYTAGETIWFKTYLVAGSFHQPSPLSKTIYFELINKNKAILFARKLLSDTGFSHGEIFLPDTLSSGNYVVRAYTSWMKNFDHDYFFEKEIKIWNPTEEIQSNDLSNAEEIDLQFFPESGSLVTGIQSRVAFKAIQSNGKGVQVQGKILDGERNLVTTIQSNHLGMGYFELTPEADGKYFCILNKGYEKTFDLPNVSMKGYVMTISTNEEGDVVIRVQTNGITSKKDAHVVVHSRGQLLYALKADLKKNLFIAKIPKEKHLTGINQVTLFSEENIPVAERIFFVNHESQLDVKLTTTKKSYHPREKVDLSIHVRDKSGNPVEGNFSLTVIDNQRVYFDGNSDNILSNLLLSSDLKGHIEDPGYYFNPANNDRQKALDILMLTQGWRKFSWNELLSDKWPNITHQIDQGLSIKGRVVNPYNKKGLGNSHVTLYSGSNASFWKILSADDGSFEFNNLMFYDSAYLFASNQKKNSSRPTLIQLEKENPVPISNEIDKLSLQLLEYEKKYIERSNELLQINKSFDIDDDVIVLDEVEVIDRQGEIEPLKIYGKGTVTVETDQIKAIESIRHPLDIIRGRVAGVIVSNSALDYTVQIRGFKSISNNPQPLIFVDNVQMNLSDLKMINPMDIESIEIFKGPDAVIFGSSGVGGAILFYTKLGSGKTENTKYNRDGVATIGYSVPREFYVPKYDLERPENVKPDKRTTIYWNPNIIIDSTGNASVSFFNSDEETSITALIEGISFSGVIGKNEFRYQVSRN
jgi:hypothetical protein